MTRFPIWALHALEPSPAIARVLKVAEERDAQALLDAEHAARVKDARRSNQEARKFAPGELTAAVPDELLGPFGREFFPPIKEPRPAAGIDFYVDAAGHAEAAVAAAAGPLAELDAAAILSVRDLLLEVVLPLPAGLRVSLADLFVGLARARLQR